jgi:hypothetical protein
MAQIAAHGAVLARPRDIFGLDLVERLDAIAKRKRTQHTATSAALRRKTS